MSKKVLLAICLALTCVFAALSLGACEYVDYDGGHAHNYEDWQIITKPTKTQEGLAVRICNDCEDGEEGHYLVVVLPKLNEEDKYDTEAITAATCTVAGEMKCTYVSPYNNVIIFNADVEMLPHTYGEWVDEVPSTPYVNGTKGHYTCSVCGKHFDEDNNEISDEDYVLPLVFHYSEDWSSDDNKHWHACTDEGLTHLKSDEAAHTWNNGEVTTAATCEAKGVKTYTCTVCGKTKTEEIAATGHDYVFDSFVWTGYTAKAKYICSNDSNHVDLRTATVTSEVTTAPTCTATGVKTYTATYDGHSATKTETLSATGHNYVYNSFVWDGYTAKAKYVCSKDGNHVDLRNATVTNQVTTAPTCTTTGVRTYTATYDGHSATKTETISATGHNYVYNSFVWTDYTAKAKYVCSHDSNHVELHDATVTSEVTTAPTCTATGVRTYTATYDGHSATKTETISATGHNYVYNSFVWTDYTAKAKYVCSHDSNHVDLRTATVTSEVTTAPTCTETGVRTYTATYDGHTDTKTETLSATGHNYVYNSFVWDGYTAKAKYVCSHDSSHVDLRNATVTNQVTTAPTCTATGVRTYTATYDGHSDTKTETISATGHNYVYNSFVWTDYTAKAKYVCSHDSNHVELHDATVTSEVTTAPTCTTTGVRTYTATYDGHTDTKNETLSATGHAYVFDSFVWTGYTAKAKYVCSHDGNHVDLRTATMSSEVTTQPTCTATGVKVYTASYDGHTDTKNETLSATGHNYVYNSFVWTDYTAKAKYVCSKDSEHVDLRTATVTSEVTTAPTCTETGVRTYTATYDGHSATKTETIAATGHDYVFDSFVWTDYTAKAKCICSHDSKHVEQYDATVTSEVTTPATYTAPGVRTYTATYGEHTDTKTETIAQLVDENNAVYEIDIKTSGDIEIKDRIESGESGEFIVGNHPATVKASINDKYVITFMNGGICLKDIDLLVSLPSAGYTITVEYTLAENESGLMLVYNGSVDAENLLDSNELAASGECVYETDEAGDYVINFGNGNVTVTKITISAVAQVM